MKPSENSGSTQVLDNLREVEYIRQIKTTSQSLRTTQLKQCKE